VKFAVDCMLGKLAKWLKILGFDTLFFPRIEDDALLSLANQENRVMLLRDNELIARARPNGSLFITSEDWQDQLRQVLDKYDIRSKAQPFSRCIECNIHLKKLSRAEAKNLVTPFIWENAKDFALCPKCARIFWKGTHSDDMMQKIRQFLADPA